MSVWALTRALGIGLWLGGAVQAAPPLSEPTAQQLPLWRGFNLQEMFNRDWHNEAFHEEDFRWISELGFNFVRLPLDYRIWIEAGDWWRIDPKPLERVDQAVAWGRQYGIHVCLNFHRAPGYTVATPPEAQSLWEDEEALRVCAWHWATFARRYRGVPNRALSFNLLNEPADVDPNTHARVIRALVAAIRVEDPNRLILIDGRSWGRLPCPELADLGIAQATRGYTPSSLTHYRASWVSGSDRWPVPTWPIPLGCAGYLYGPNKSEPRTPVVLNTRFTTAPALVLRVGTVSSSARLAVSSGRRLLWEQAFKPGPGEGPWETVVFRPEWGIYQNVYNRDYRIELSARTREIRIENTEGDWLTLTRIALLWPDGREAAMDIAPRWGQRNEPITYDPATGRLTTERQIDREQLWTEQVAPWVALKSLPVGVLVGEWGAYNKTPHDVTLRWMTDCLENFRSAGLGWALWNFRGSFGILDSGRRDVTYEDFHGHRLDRAMLDLLQRY